ncbi:hypothetical protein [Amycolatopsis palatopharyngis]|uniref:hypothetical protein n=1 Tax=Amycolatopsis palatopharyngis TaxID=187982 RepID=UPI000E26085B|nr:hypothetical protein [Amycolatopsis palatopharyngis]
MRSTARSRSVRLFAAALAAAGSIGFLAACDETSPGEDGGTQQEDGGGEQQDEEGGGEEGEGGGYGGDGGEDDG